MAGNGSAQPRDPVAKMVPVDREIEAIATFHLRTGGGVLPSAREAAFFPEPGDDG